MEDLPNEQNEYQLEETAKVKGPFKEVMENKVEGTLKGMKGKKAAGPRGVTCGLLRALRKESVRELTNIMNKTIDRERVPGD